MKRRCDIFRCDKGRNDISSQRQCYWASNAPSSTSCSAMARASSLLSASMFRKARRVISAVIQYVFMAFSSYGFVLARLRGLIRQAALLWNARGLVAIADRSIPGPQLRNVFLPIRQVSETALAAAAPQIYGMLPPWR